MKLIERCIIKSDPAKRLGAVPLSPGRGARVRLHARLPQNATNCLAQTLLTTGNPTGHG